MRDFSGGDLLVIHLEDAGATFAEARPVINEIEHDGVLSRSKSLLSCPAETREVKEVVCEDRFAFEQIKAISAEAAAQSRNHAVRPLRNVDFGRDAIGSVQDARRI